jgi:hypothetical protein
MQVIRKMDKFRVSMLLEQIVKHSEDYPFSREEWLKWLNEPAGDRIDEF